MPTPLHLFCVLFLVGMKSVKDLLRSLVFTALPTILELLCVLVWLWLQFNSTAVGIYVPLAVLGTVGVHSWWTYKACQVGSFLIAWRSVWGWPNHFGGKTDFLQLFRVWVDTGQLYLRSACKRTCSTCMLAAPLLGSFSLAFALLLTACTFCTCSCLAAMDAVELTIDV